MITHIYHQILLTVDCMVSVSDIILGQDKTLLHKNWEPYDVFVGKVYFNILVG
jgi:hypothetical protein